MSLRVKLLSSYATAPSRATSGAAGYDLYAAYDHCIESNTRSLIKTDISIAIPEDCYAQVASRSSMAMKGIDVGAGVIDSDYRGNIGVILINHSTVDYEIKKGDRIAQLILHRIETPVVSVVDELPSSARDQGGFGSTGL